MGKNYYRTHRFGTQDKLRPSQNKYAQLTELLIALRKGKNEYLRVHHNLLVHQGIMPPQWGSGTYKLSKSPLSARQQVTAWNNAHANYTAHLATIQDDIRDKISSLDSDKHDTHSMYRLNKQQRWFGEREPLLDWWLNEETGELSHPSGKNPPKRHTAVQQPVSPQTLATYRNIVRHCFRTNKLPVQHSLSTSLDRNVATIEAPKQSKHSTIAAWLKIATLTKGKPIRIPVERNSHVDLSNLAGTLQMNYERDHDRYSIGIVKEHEPTDVFAEGAEEKELGGDLGVARALLATSEGDLYGTKFLRTLRKYDDQLSDVIDELKEKNKESGKPLSYRDDHRYRNLNKRIRDFAKNEVNRIVNRMIARGYNVLVFEKLDFRSTKLSRRINRLLSRIGKNALKIKLANVSEASGVRVVYVPSAYSSQECWKCKFVHRLNRKGDLFKCRFCGWKCHADVNGARVIRSRRAGLDPSLTDSSSRVAREKLHQILEERFIALHGLSFEEALARGERVIGSPSDSIAPTPITV